MIKGHFGCGPIYHDGWINVDKSSANKTDICCDFLQHSFDNNYFDVIYLCHCYEHLQFPEDAVEALNRFYFWLKPNGILRISVPSLEIAVKAYVENRDMKFLLGEPFNNLHYKKTRGEYLNKFITSFDHQMCYDFELLSELFKDAGFREIRNCQPNESRIPSFNLDRFIGCTLYVEAIK